MKKRKKKSVVKVRNWLAIHAWNRKAGPHKNKKKEASRKACRRKKIRAN